MKTDFEGYGIELEMTELALHDKKTKNKNFKTNYVSHTNIV